MPSFWCQAGPGHGNSVGNSESTAETVYPNASPGRPFHSNDVSLCYTSPNGSIVKPHSCETDKKN